MLCLNVLPCNYSQVVLCFSFGTTRYKSDCISQKSSSDILLVPNQPSTTSRALWLFLFFFFVFFFTHENGSKSIVFLSYAVQAIGHWWLLKWKIITMKILNVWLWLVHIWLWPPDWMEEHTPILTKVILDSCVQRPLKCFCLNFWPTYSSRCGVVFLITYFQYHLFKRVSGLSNLFFIRGWGIGGEKKKNSILHSVSLEILNWFVGCLTSFNILIFSNLNSAGGEITAYIKYARILLLKWK